MKLEDFTRKREFLYHLTDRENLDNILSQKAIFSTDTIVSKSALGPEEKEALLSNRRKTHINIDVDGVSHKIRDQRPISIVNLVKCLTTGYTVHDFFKLLNSRVFFWPTTKRLQSHYNRYKQEKPIIIKVSTEDLLTQNAHAEFCRLNSGATRSNSHLNGAPPLRGEGTFSPAVRFPHNVSDVAEVTFPNSCALPSKIFIGESPEGPWEAVKL